MSDVEAIRPQSLAVPWSLWRGWVTQNDPSTLKSRRPSLLLRAPTVFGPAEVEAGPPVVQDRDPPAGPERRMG